MICGRLLTRLLSQHTYEAHVMEETTRTVSVPIAAPATTAQTIWSGSTATPLYATQQVVGTLSPAAVINPISFL
jgi:hypothetical protein